MKLTSWIQIVREIDLRRIEHDAEMRFGLMLVGDPEQTGALARALSASATDEGVHPWIVREPLPLRAGLTLPVPAVGVIVSPSLEPDAAHVEALRRLKAAGVHTVTVLTGDASAMPEHAVLRRDDEDARAIVPLPPDAATIEATLAPAIIGIAGPDAALPLALARRLRPLRAAYVARLVEEVARTNGGFALSTGLVDLVPGMSLPLTVADVVVLTKNQIVMAYRIALAAGRAADTRVLLGEVVAVIGAGLLFRQMARELVGLLPAVGIVPKVAVAYAGTHLVGAVVRTWALEERDLAAGELREIGARAIDAGRALAEDLHARVVSERTRRRTSGRSPEGEGDGVQ